MPEIGEIKRAKEIGYKGSNKWIWHACEKCSKERWVVLKKDKPRNLLCIPCANKIFPYDRSGNKNPRWKGGKRKNKEGYVLIKIYPNDFFYPMADGHSYIKEHRLAMAKYLGRCLQPWEIVHHINGNRQDNRIGNLQLVSEGQHNQVTILENKIDRQSQLIEDLRKEVKLLEWHIKELEERSCVK